MHTLESGVRLALPLAFAVAAACQAVPSPAARTLLGFTAASSARQADLETRFRHGIDPESISSLHRPLAERPHPSGTPATKALVEHLERTLGGFGLDVKVHEYQALLSHPRQIDLEMTTPHRRAISVAEPAIAADPTSSHPELGGGHIAYSANGVAAGEIVYVNYGLPADYAELQKKGVAVQGRIALARYGRSHRAVKVHTAQQHGATAVILYSDPDDDGAAKGSVWPSGYWRGGDMLQRGNAKFSWFWHGDPLTPGVAATSSAKRLDPASAPTLPRIPVVVVAANEAAALKAGAVSVRLRVDMDQRLMPIYNVIATLAGARHPDRQVLFGTHHDAWTFGGVDPGTGTSVLLEVARGLGELAKSGWRPSRTIALAFWDAEEFGLVGSTEYAEDLRDTLQEQLVAYVNTDMYMAGRFDPGGVPSLSPFVADVARDVTGWKMSVYEEWQQSTKSSTPDLEPLGSGADFVPFQDHLGVPTLAIEFIGENGYGFGTYHSNYDSRAYAEAIADPGFRQGAILARLLGTLALRMSEADVLPFRFSHYATRLKEAITAAQLSTLSERVDRIRATARELEAAIDAGLQSGRVPSGVAALNDRLARLEQRLADDDGAPESRWYRHVFYGWNIYSLYDGQPFPGHADAVRRRDADRIRHETVRIERALDRMLAELTAARTFLP
jgi:N-acetylated-alpha-linked acidic dipeptidase